MHATPDGSTHPGEPEGCKVCEHPETVEQADIGHMTGHMTGPEHYALAEQLVAEALQLPHVVLTAPGGLSQAAAEDLKRQFTERTGVTNVVVLSQGVTTNASDLIAAAQVHATLANVAAQWSGLLTGPQRREWQNAIS